MFNAPLLAKGVPRKGVRISVNMRVLTWLGEDIYTCLDNYKFWEGYDGHDNVIIDDIRGDFCKFHQLLKLLDRYKHIKLNIKL